MSQNKSTSELIKIGLDEVIEKLMKSHSVDLEESLYVNSAFKLFSRMARFAGLIIKITVTVEPKPNE